MAEKKIDKKAKKVAKVTDKKAAPKPTSEKKAKKAKKEKILSYKKLPKIFRKKYLEKKYQKKIIKSLQIPADRELVASMFVKSKNEKKPKKGDVYAVPKDFTFKKSDKSRLKVIARDIDSHGSRIKWSAVVAVVVFIAAFSAVFITFKNPIVKKVLVTSCQKVFEAKTEIASVDLKLMDASLKIEGLAIGNKDDEFKNLFEASLIDVNFNLTQALRGKFHAKNLEVSGIALNTERTTSCALTKSKKADKKKSSAAASSTSEKKSKKKDDNSFMASLSAKSSQSVNKLKEMSADMLGGTDVDSIVENIKSQFQTAAVADESVKTVNDLVAKWQNKPAELTKQVNDFSASVQSLQNLNVNNIKDVAQLQKALTDINTAINTGKTLTESAKTISTDLQVDSQTVTTLTDKVTAAVTADKNLVSEKLATATNALSNSKTLFNNAIDSVGYSVLGKYYPYAKKAIDYAATMKENSAKKANTQETKAEKEKKKKVKANKQGVHRLAGTTFWYKKDSPSLLIENIKASGTGFSAVGKEITNDQDVRGKPSSLNCTFTAAGATHNANAVMDARSYSKEPLINLSYKGTNFSTAIDGTKIASSSGIPSINGRSNIDFTLSADQNLFSGKGNVAMSPVSLTSDGFENATVTKYYNQALASVKKLNFGFTTSFTEEKGVDLKLLGNFADLFANSLQTIVASMGSDAKEAAIAKLNSEINSSQNGYLASAKSFLGIEDQINSENLKISNLQATLDSKRAEIENAIKKKTEEAASQAISNMIGVPATSGSSSTNSAASSAASAAGSFLKGLSGSR
ncbi:MAG: TIGR03545 family protein [Treponemataceae bacterium]|nr:TIGR03545 family protein [Treponemataceae bacterium]